MIRRSAEELVRNELRSRQIWKVFVSGVAPRSSSTGRNGVDESCGGSGGHLGRFIGASVGHHSRGGPDDLRPVQGSDYRWWVGRTETSSSPVAGYHEADHSCSQWCLNKLARDSNQSTPLYYWNRCVPVRMLSTKSSDGDGISHFSSDEQTSQTQEKATGRPISVEDLQHEEIVGPTVERDESDTANQLRESLGQLTTFMTSLRNGFVLLGGVQLLALFWNSQFHGVGFFLGLSQDFALVGSFVLAYLLRVFGSRVDFFSKIEGRSRMRILTLALQATRMLSLFFFRSSFVVKGVALCSSLALLADLCYSHLSTL